MLFLHSLEIPFSNIFVARTVYQSRNRFTIRVKRSHLLPHRARLTKMQFPRAGLRLAFLSDSRCPSANPLVSFLRHNCIFALPHGPCRSMQPAPSKLPSGGPTRPYVGPDPRQRVCPLEFPLSKAAIPRREACRGLDSPLQRQAPPPKRISLNAAQCRCDQNAMAILRQALSGSSESAIAFSSQRGNRKPPRRLETVNFNSP